MSKTVLNHFGHVLMSQVRDSSIDDWTMILDGRMKGDRAEKVRERLSKCSEADREVFLQLVPNVVDSVLHHLLVTLEERDDVRVGVSAQGNVIESIKDVSDGLAGELYSDEGWIARFSKKSSG